MIKCCRHVSSPLRFSYRLAVALVFSLAVLSSKVYAIEAALGLGMVEEGDDRPRPAAGMHVGLDERYAMHLISWGREYGPVTEQTFLFAALRRWSLFKSSFLFANLGVVVMDERIQIHFKNAADKDHNQDEDNFNAGGVFGVSATLPKIAPFYLSLSWDSHVFPAGVNGGLLLSTGRKQTIMLNMGATIK